MPLSRTSAAHQSCPYLFTHLHHLLTACSIKGQPTATGCPQNNPQLRASARPEVRLADRTRNISCRARASLPAPDSTERKPRLAIFVSGGGSNFRAIHAGILDGRINAEVAVSRHLSSFENCTELVTQLLRVACAADVCFRLGIGMQVVISDVPGCGGWEYAAAHDIPTEVYPSSAKAKEAGSQPLSTEALVAAVKKRYGVQYVLLAGYLKVSGICDIACCPSHVAGI